MIEDYWVSDGLWILRAGVIEECQPEGSDCHSRLHSSYSAYVLTFNVSIAVNCIVKYLCRESIEWVY